ncbi:MAG: isoprenylcysteine carboxylmethyltransferase family protein [Chitinophagaceae bacterium]|nr:isoprenylcysteine carboxylmethyltransferase family protein [Chitinophagaceae bacterium]
MSSKISSLIALAIAIAGLVYLIYAQHLFSTNPVSIAIQLSAAALMIWARITFGLRSFHATANTTSGELVTNGPYQWLRHPIYASIIYFSWASVIAYPFLETFAAVCVITAGLYTRMLLEEKFLLIAYPEYKSYMKQTRRVIPYLF